MGGTLTVSKGHREQRPDPLRRARRWPVYKRGDRFVWTVYMNGHVPKVDGVPIAGEARELEQAAGTFKRS